MTEEETVAGRSSGSNPDRTRAERMERLVQRQLAADEERARRDEARASKERERERKIAEREGREKDAARRTEELAERIAELETILARCAIRPATRVSDLAQVDLEPFDPGLDGEVRRRPIEPVRESGGLFGRRRARQWYEQQKAQYDVAFVAFKAGESERARRVAARQAEHERYRRERAESARARAEWVRVGLDRGDGLAVEEFAKAAIGALPLPSAVDLEPRVVYRGHPREVFVDIRLPGDAVVPAEKTVTYIVSRDALTIKDRPATEREAVYRRVLAQLPLVVADALFRSLAIDIVETVAVTGRLTFTDPASGRRIDDVLVSLIVEREKFEELVLDAHELDAVRCVRALGARLSDHPLARETVPAFLTFDEAKYKLGTAVDVAAGLDGRPDLGTMPWADFEQLVRELLLAMQGHDTRVTRGSRDDGIDGVVFDCHAALGGEYIVQAKRYNKVVPAVDVRALAGTMHDKRANHALFVTTAWFSPDGRRFAADNRVRLIEGTELRHLLLEHLALDVLVPEQRTRRRT